ncbi:DUF397 domain-containing protein [Streptomyces sp. B6B3]|uniref:DUF397 domain-containing protein n=1 Tax=Streptomyces sp. B6B3 TaxID=3153570 RepID=UPI00325F3188
MIIIEPGTAVWRKSSYSGSDNGECLEVADGFPGVVPVRDSKNPDVTLLVSASAWQSLLKTLNGSSPAPR